MKSLASILSFHPTRLAEARAKVVKLHPGTRSRPRPLGPAEVATLRIRVGEAANAADPGSALIALAHDLLERELLAVVRSTGDWADLRGPVATIARERPLPSYVPVLWRLWQAFPVSEQIVELLTEMAGRFGLDGAIAAPYVDDALGWLREEHLIDAVVRWTGHRAIDWDELPEIPESPFDADTPLIKRVFHRTLQIGSREQLFRMQQEVILGGWEQMSGEHHMQACANFLERVQPASWPERERVLDKARNTYGIPPKPGVKTVPLAGALKSITTFWGRVSEARREEFRQHFIALELAVAFEGDSTPDRREFWMAQRRNIVSVCHGTAGNTHWSLIDFPGFSVVEFFELGNAAYLYPADHRIVRRIRLRTELKRQASSPSELKSWSDNFSPPGDNRIIHRDDWQHYAQATLETWQVHFP